jgi:hypothetical protein
MVEQVVARQARLRQAAEHAQDAIVERDRRQQILQQAWRSGATPLPLRASDRELDRRKRLVGQAFAFIEAARATS